VERHRLGCIVSDKAATLAQCSALMATPSSHTGAQHESCAMGQVPQTQCQLGAAHTSNAHQAPSADIDENGVSGNAFPGLGKQASNSTAMRAASVSVDALERPVRRTRSSSAMAAIAQTSLGALDREQRSGAGSAAAAAGSREGAPLPWAAGRGAKFGPTEEGGFEEAAAEAPQGSGLGGVPEGSAAVPGDGLAPRDAGASITEVALPAAGAPPVQQMGPGGQDVIKQLHARVVAMSALPTCYARLATWPLLVGASHLHACPSFHE
jgi:hypothetical protein